MNAGESMSSVDETLDVVNASDAADAPATRTRKRSLTRMQLGVLGYIASRQAPDGTGAALTKKEIAQVVGCDEKTVERAIVRLRTKGMIEVVPRHGETGAQLGNSYRIVH
ncbi:helix-turn-helix domain-containing protein [Adlercreutzia sp. ZJ138]|uniref:helix-turn-helix domain-containing protein n=1 Tax=Adlercreutzia sp. ZJ138 TaxID=2709405 RepID=UPI0013ECBE55|nr:helix-turn-helix domain-containing protein [Adlercreutzia sp. ZJ138]